MSKAPPDPHEGAPEELVRARLSMALAYAQMLEEGYDALLHHRVKYRDLPEFKDDKYLEEAARLPLVRGADRYIQWITRVTAGIRAAVKRTTFRKV